MDRRVIDQRITRCVMGMVLAPLSLAIAFPLTLALSYTYVSAQHTPLGKAIFAASLLAPLGVPVAVLYCYLLMAIVGVPFYLLLLPLHRWKVLSLIAAGLLGYLALAVPWMTTAHNSAAFLYGGPAFLQKLFTPLNIVSPLNPMSWNGVVVGVVFWLIARPREAQALQTS